METEESSNEQGQGPGVRVDGADALEARWEHWRVSVSTEDMVGGAGALIARVPSENLLLVLGDARDPEGPGFSRLVDLTAVDYGLEASPSRFELVYWLSQPGGGGVLRARVALGTEVGLEAGAGLEIDSIARLWASANWLEREVFDLFGIRFRGHPDLRRLLLPSDFEGAPLRKDYPRQPDLPLPKSLETHEVLESPEAQEADEV